MTGSYLIMSIETGMYLKLVHDDVTGNVVGKQWVESHTNAAGWSSKAKAEKYLEYAGMLHEDYQIIQPR